MDALTLTFERPDAADVAALLGRHHALMREGSPEESCHVMDVSELLAEDVTVLAAREDGALLGGGALKIIAPGSGELKSMHTAQEARGRGVARALLLELIEMARRAGVTLLNLETGTAPLFAPARALYTANGFKECPPFGTYTFDPLSVFMSRSI